MIEVKWTNKKGQKNQYKLLQNIISFILVEITVIFHL